MPIPIAHSPATTVAHPSRRFLRFSVHKDGSGSNGGRGLSGSMSFNAEACPSVCRASAEPTDLHYPPPYSSPYGSMRILLIISMAFPSIALAEAVCFIPQCDRAHKACRRHTDSLRLPKGSQVLSRRYNQRGYEERATAGNDGRRLE